MKASKTYFSIFAFAIISAVSCKPNGAMNGTWEYDGGIYNGKKETAPKDYKMQRIYTDKTYEGFVVEENAEPEKYDGGNYEIRDTAYLETTTFSSQPSQTLNKTVTYQYKKEGDLFTMIGTLPSGMRIEEYWKKLK